jgi:hypothetical protein
VEGWLRSLIALGFSALLGAGTSNRASASTITVVMTGQITSAIDSNAVTDGSLAVGVPYTLAMTYDDSIGDADSDPLSGTYLIPAATASYSITVGNYQFSSNSILNVGLLDGFFDPSEDTLSWFADQFTATGVFDPGVSLGSAGYSNTALYDFAGTALASDEITAIVWDRSLYEADDAALYLLLEVLDPRTVGQDFIELQGTIATMAVLPEPAAIVLLAVGAIGVALRRRFA